MSIDPDQYLADSVNVVPEFLQEEFTRISSDLYYWNRQFADAHKKSLTTKLHVKHTYALKWFELKQELTIKNGKTTIADVEQAIELDDVYRQSKADEIEAEYERDKVKGICEAIRAKKDAIVSLGASIRQEQEQDASIKNRRNHG